MLQGAQLAHLESLLGGALQSTSPAPQYSAIAPVLQVPSHLPQVSMPIDSTHYFLLLLLLNTDGLLQMLVTGDPL